MTKEQFYTYQEDTFEAFCKALIRNESIDAHRELATRTERETAISALSEKELSSLCAEDCYRPSCTTFFVRGATVKIFDPCLADALQFLPPHLREILLLFYCMEYSAPKIGSLLHLPTSTVHYRRNEGVRCLKKLLEGMAHEC